VSKRPRSEPSQAAARAPEAGSRAPAQSAKEASRRRAPASPSPPLPRGGRHTRPRKLGRREPALPRAWPAARPAAAAAAPPAPRPPWPRGGRAAAAPAPCCACAAAPGATNPPPSALPSTESGCVGGLVSPEQRGCADKAGDITAPVLRVADIRSPNRARSGLLALWLHVCEDAVENRYVSVRRRS